MAVPVVGRRSAAVAVVAAVVAVPVAVVAVAAAALPYRSIWISKPDVARSSGFLVGRRTRPEREQCRRPSAGLAKCRPLNSWPGARPRHTAMASSSAFASSSSLAGFDRGPPGSARPHPRPPTAREPRKIIYVNHFVRVAAWKPQRRRLNGIGRGASRAKLSSSIESQFRRRQPASRREPADTWTAAWTRSARSKRLASGCSLEHETGLHVAGRGQKGQQWGAVRVEV